MKFEVLFFKFTWNVRISNFYYGIGNNITKYKNFLISVALGVSTQLSRTVSLLKNVL